MKFIPLFAGLLLFGGLACARPDATLQRQSDASLDALVASRLHSKAVFDSRRPEDAETPKALQALLGEGLTQESAVRIALLNNPHLRGELESLGVAQADLVQAGLLQNPRFGASVRFPDHGGRTATDFSLTQELISLFTRSLRKQIAAGELDRARLRVAQAVLDLEAEVRRAFVSVQAAEQVRDLRQTLLDASETAVELSRRQRAAGNISELDASIQTGSGVQARLDFAKAETQSFEDRERLTRLLGLSDGAWTLAAKLAEVPKSEPSLDALEARALARRLDLSEARAESQVITNSLSLAKKSRWFGSVEAGLSTERDPEGNRVTGPLLNIELPLFDRHQAQVQRLEAQSRQAQSRVVEMEGRIHSEVRLAVARLGLARNVADRTAKVLVPLRERIVALTQERYNSMLAGVYDLLLAKQIEATTYKEAIESVRDYWIARADLDRALGGAIQDQGGAIFEEKTK